MITADPLDNRYVYVSEAGGSDISGLGLFAKTDIPAGTTFATYTGLIMSDQVSFNVRVNK
jgi:hypothetical protein